MTILFRFFYALFAVYFAFLAVTSLFVPTVPLHDVIDYALFAVLGGVWLWDSFSSIDFRFTSLAGAVAFTWTAVWPEYSLFTALFGAVAGISIIATYVAFSDHARKARENARFAEELRNDPPTNPHDAKWADEWLDNYDSKRKNK